ncbi:hypothetical protein [Streptomyces phytohabitans]|uniref:hypothetical protein n=1 Tax=Streptomyces phytohabitans TaxID=1150371 RepID=UPI00345B9C49
MPRRAIAVVVNAVAILLSFLLAADTAAAQVVPVVKSSTATTQQTTSAPAAETDAETADSESRRRARVQTGTGVPTLHSLPVCACDFRASHAVTRAPKGAGSKGLPRERSVGVQVLHQTFRC